jgi:hypothetical protein|tara:strand:- start:5061 stop:8063 length:3003 start_codon:yes stop_codon:yes gene_type:complete
MSKIKVNEIEAYSGTTVTQSSATTFSANSSSIRIANATNEIDTSSGNLTLDSAGGTVTVDDHLVVSGNLTVNGSTTTVNSTVTTVDDPIITVGGDAAPTTDDNKDRGVEFRWHNGSAARVGFFGYDDSTGRFVFIPNATNSSEVFSGNRGELESGGLRISDDGSTYGIQVGISSDTEIDTASGNLTLDSAGGTVIVDDNLTVSGNLTVNGTTSTINSTVTTVDDPVITLGGDTAPGSDDNKDRGVEFRYHNGSAAKIGFLGYDDSTGRMVFIPDATNSSEVFSGNRGELEIGGVRISDDGSTFGIQIGVTSDNEIDTAAGNLTLDSAGGTVAVDDNLTVAGDLTVDTNAFKVDSTNNFVGIGTATPASYNDSADNLVVYEAGNGGITIATGVNDWGSIYFADGTSGDSTHAGCVQYHHGTDKLYLGSAASDNRVTLDSAGRFGIGVTDPDAMLEVYNNGTQLKLSQDADSSASITVAASSHTTIATAETGNLILDAAGNIELNADGGTVTFKDAGASLGTITSSGFSGTSSVATTVTVSDNESTAEDNLITFVAGASGTTGNHGLEMDGNLNYNPSTGRLTATQLAGTLQTAAQANVTSVGTLSSLTVSGDLVVDTSTLKVDSSNNRVGVGTASPAHALHVQDASVAVVTNSADGTAKSLKFKKSRHATDGSHTVLQKADDLGRLSFYASDGSSFLESARITAGVDGRVDTVGSSDMPGKIKFATASDGASSPTTRVVIDSSGGMGIGTTRPERRLDICAGEKVDGIRMSWDDAGAGYTDGWSEITVEDAGGSLRLSTYDPTAAEGDITLAPDGKLKFELLDNDNQAFTIREGINTYLEVSTQNTMETVAVHKLFEARSGVIQPTTPINDTSFTASMGNSGGILVMSHSAAQSTVTLPSSSGNGLTLKIAIGAVNTNNHRIICAGSDKIGGSVNLIDLDGSDQSAFAANAASTNTITMNGTTTGGQIGDYIELMSIAAGKWAVIGQLVCPTGSNPATPFS